MPHQRCEFECLHFNCSINTALYDVHTALWFLLYISVLLSEREWLIDLLSLNFTRSIKSRSTEFGPTNPAQHYPCPGESTSVPGHPIPSYLELFAINAMTSNEMFELWIILQEKEEFYIIRCCSLTISGWNAFKTICKQLLFLLQYCGEQAIPPVNEGVHQSQRLIKWPLDCATVSTQGRQLLATY